MSKIDKVRNVADLIEMSIEVPITGYQPFVYAVVFTDTAEFYIGCKYQRSTVHTRDGGQANPEILISGKYNTCSRDVLDKIEQGEPHTRHVIAVGDKHEVTSMEKRFVEVLWDVEGRLNMAYPVGVPVSHSSEARAAMSAAKIGKKLPQSTKDAMSAARKGVPKEQSHKDSLRMYQYKRWSEDQYTELVRLREEDKLTWPQIAVQLKCCLATARSRYNMHKSMQTV